MTTLHKLPSVEPDIVRMDQEWESWDMDKLKENLQNWLRRNKIRKGLRNQLKESKGIGIQEKGRRELKYVYIVTVKIIRVLSVQSFNTLEKRRVFFRDNKLCFNPIQAGGTLCPSPTGFFLAVPKWFSVG